MGEQKKVTFINSTQKEIRQKLRVAAYCRVSTDSDVQLESLETQKSHYEQYITSHDDWIFAGLYYDEDITGTKKEKRPNLHAGYLLPNLEHLWLFLFHYQILIF